MAGRRLVVEIVGNTAALNRALTGTQSTMRKVGRAAGIMGGAIAAGLGVAAKVGFDELKDSQAVMAQTEAVIKSTGGVAKVSADHVDALSQSLLELSGVDDELITEGQNMLLTFRNIHNEAGRGNDIFDQATKTTLDFSVAMGKDMKSAALMVGKALNMPTRGVTKLERAGVQFSDKQKKLIARLEESGDVMGAQKVILKELQTQFGGSAAAAGELLPAELNKAREAFADVAAGIVEGLLPSITTLLTHLSSLMSFLKEHPAIAQAVAIGLAALSVALLALSVASSIAAASMAALWVASGIGVLVLLAAAVVVAYKKFETFRNVVDSVIGFVSEHWEILLGVFGLIFPVIVRIIRRWSDIKSAAVTAFNAIKGPILSVIGVIQRVIGWVDTLINRIGDIAGAVSSIPGIPSVSGLAGRAARTLIPGLQHGGIVKRPTLAMVGEAGPEAVIPLNRLNGGGGVMQVNIQLGERTLATALIDLNAKYARQNGGRGLF